MSPPLEAALIASAGAFIIVAAIIAWALLRLARGGDRWTTAANTLSNRLTDHDRRLTALEEVGRYPRQAGTVERRSGAPGASGGLR